MPHLHILYFFITVILGIVSLAVNTYLYLKYQVKFIKYFLIFHLAFTLDILFAGLLMYVAINMSSNAEFIHLVVYHLAMIMHFILMFTIPLFMHDLCEVTGKRIRNIILAAITIITYTHSYYSEFISNNEQWALIAEYVEAFVFITFVLYAFFAGIYYYRRLSENLRRQIIFKILILLGILIPGIVYDSIPNLSRSIVFPQLLYCGMGIIFASDLLKHYAFYPKNQLSLTFRNTSDAVHEGEFFNSYNLSPREHEIASLVLQGYNNQKIAKTLFIALPTVKTHIRNMFSKFAVSNRYELLILYKNSSQSTLAGAENLDSAG